MYPNLKLQLWKAGLRQNRMAKLLGVDETMLSKIVNGFREPSPEMRAKMAKILQSDEAWLFERPTPVAVREDAQDGSGHAVETTTQVDRGRK